MINNIISGAMLIIYGYYFFKDLKKSMMLIYVFGMIAPNFILGDFVIPLYIVIFFEMMILLITFRPKWLLSLRFDYKDMFIFLSMIYLNTDTALNVMFTKGADWNIFAIISDWRFTLWYILIRKLDFKNYDSFITPVLFINFIAVIYQFFFPYNVEIFYDFYTKASFASSQLFTQSGEMIRPIGTLGSPVTVGAFSLLCVSYYLIEKNIKYRGSKLFISIIIGVLAMSKNAIMGVPIIFVIYMLIHMANIKTIFKISVVGIILLAVLYIIMSMDIPQIAHLKVYVNFLEDPMAAFNTRYTSGGTVYHFYDLLADHYLFGVGSGSFNGIDIVDSMYIVSIARGGIIFTIIYLLWLKVTSRNILIFISMIFISLSGPFIYSLILLPFVLDTKVYDRENIEGLSELDSYSSGEV